jgi:hypothetical protein
MGIRIVRKPYRFAQHTTVGVEKSRTEIEALLRRHGAKDLAMAYADNADKAMIGFRWKDRNFKIVLPLPATVPLTPMGRAKKNPEGSRAQEVKRRWRALLLVVKAKLEAIDIGISTMHDEFLAFTMLPGNRTVSDLIQPRITAILEGSTLPLLPSKNEKSD